MENRSHKFYTHTHTQIILPSRVLVQSLAYPLIYLGDGEFFSVYGWKFGKSAYHFLPV